MLYEAILMLRGGREEAGKMEQFWAGGLAGMICWLSVLPFDVVKSRMQAEEPERRQIRSMTDCFYKSYKAHGLSVFFRGAVAMSARAFPVNGVTFVVYETLLEYCNSQYRE